MANDEANQDKSRDSHHDLLAYRGLEEDLENIHRNNESSSVRATRLDTSRLERRAEEVTLLEARGQLVTLLKALIANLISCSAAQY